MFGIPGHFELLIVGFIAVLLFGNKLPKIAKSVGSAIPSFRKGMLEVEQECRDIEEKING